MLYYTYILYSQSLDRFYVGQTDNFERRIQQHLSEKGKFSSRANDWKLVFQKDFNSRADAVQLEIKIKNRGAGRFLNNIAKMEG